jgi:ABC-type branched-subunit amino acid transport system substrate-binding protein
VTGRLLVAAAALSVAVAMLVPAAPGGGAETPGVTETEILIGGTAPLSGPESAYSVVAEGAEAYFKYVNANGGVFGRSIRYLYYDDAYQPPQTVQQTRRLVEQDKVLAMFNMVGTEHSLAARPYLNELGVPQLFVGSGASVLAREAAQYPWTLGYLPSFVGEGKVYGRNIAKSKPRARVAVLYEDSTFGQDLLSGLRAGLGGKGRIVATQRYAVTDPDVNSQVAALRASKADTLMLFALPKQVVQSFVAADKLGWRPQVYVTSVSIDPFLMNIARLNTNGRTTEGALSIAFLKDASNTARWGSDPGVRLYYSIMEKYNPGGDARAVANLYGMAVAYTLVDVLRKAGKDLTRKGLLDAASNLNETTNPFMLPPIVVKTGPGDRFPIEQVQLYRYTKGVWRTVGPLLTTK